MGAEEEEVVVTLSGGAPWGFRLQGGSEQKRPLQVSKIRKRSKACRGGLWENDELVSINGKPCAGLSHANAMQIIDSSNGSHQMRLTASGDLSSTRLLHSPSPGQLRVLSPTFAASLKARLLSPEPAGPPATSPPEQQRQQRQQKLESLTSPPDSEAYYGETDSDADNMAQEKHRRARKKSPRSPPEGSNNKMDESQGEVSLSELSGYDSTPEAAVQAGETGESVSGVAKREIVCEPSSRTDTPFSESEMLLQPPELEGRELSPEAMLLQHATKVIRAERHLIPMVGPVEHPVDEDLTTTYTEKAKQAKLHRSESVQEKNVKEAKTKCRTIASLLTDAPNPHSKVVLMFKKRRQRAKKYTLVSFGSVDEDRCYEEEDGVFPTSESEFDEEGFSDARSLTNHSDWDTYLDIEKSKEGSEQQVEQVQQGLSEASGRGVQLFEQQRQKSGKYTVEHAPAQNVHLEAVHVSSTASGFNRSARPFTPGFSGQRPATSSVIFRPSAPRKSFESLGGQSTVPSPFLPVPTVAPVLPPTVMAVPPCTSSSLPTSEPFASREQRVSVPAPRTGILQEARRRSNKKPMFNPPEEKKKNSPNPELLSLVQNLDEKPKGDHHGVGFESGPEEDFLSLGAEACNFMQSSGRKFKTPPPVAPKPQQQAGASGGLVNGSTSAHEMPQLKGKGAELFAKRQSRMDKFVVEAAPRPGPKPRTPSPTPSLPSSWKYSSNIRAPPPIAYNPLHSPFYPLAASRSQASKAESKVKKAPGSKSGIQAIDFMRHQPYQLKSAMFCFGESPSPQPPTARTYEIRRFSTPSPIPTSSSIAPTVLAPRSATTLDEPVWRTEMTSPAPITPAPFQAAPTQYQSSPELSQLGQGTSPNPSSSSGFQVARPRFSAARTGMQAHVWRPGSGHQ
uniref:Synaptopodin 2-like protein n=1 Tax=Sphenodon punctatus TaxID=8508 RepID=A0A8D0HCX1_SPHPU